MRMASGSHMMSYNANPHSYQTSHVSRLDVLFSSNYNIQKSLCGLCFWASDFLIDRFYVLKYFN